MPILACSARSAVGVPGAAAAAARPKISRAASSRLGCRDFERELGQRQLALGQARVAAEAVGELDVRGHGVVGPARAA